MSAFVHPWGLLLLAVVPACYWLYRFAERKRVEGLRRFGTWAVGRHRSWWLLIAGALAVLCFAVAQPAVSRDESAKNRAPDVVFLLDVSRSMGTRDRTESRIDLARSAIRGIVNRAADQRFGLVVFAGNASIECPLTNDYVFFQAQLRVASRGSVTVGGTRMADAIRFAAEKAFDDASRNARELVLISDGGDESGSRAAAIGELEKRKIRLVVAGVGDREARGFVPESEVDPRPVVYQGQAVRAPLDENALQDLCRASERCSYATLPSVAFEQAVVDRRALIAASAESGSFVGGALALGAAVLLAGESLLRRFVR